MPTTIASAALILAASSGFQATLDDVRLAQSVPGVSAVVSRNDETLFAGASGVADLESGRVLTADTPLYAGSLSKVFTAVLVLHLVEQGSLSLAQPAPGISTARDPAPEAISVVNLLTHSSGLSREGDFGYWFARSTEADNNSFEQWTDEGSLTSAQRANTTWKPHARRVRRPRPRRRDRRRTAGLHRAPQGLDARRQLLSLPARDARSNHG